VLRQVGLGRLAGELDTVANWAQRLSLGGRQRLAFAAAPLASRARIAKIAQIIRNSFRHRRSSAAADGCHRWAGARRIIAYIDR
jgi:hypothetical protein